MKGLRTWWQRTTGNEETPFDGDAPAWMISMVVHMLLFILAGIIGWSLPEDNSILVTALPEEEEQIDLDEELPKEFAVSETPQEEIGANSVEGDLMAESLAPRLADVSEIANPEPETFEFGDIQVNNAILESTGLKLSHNLTVKGAAGVGTTGADGAIDRITEEIKLSLEQRPTLVVWMFDESYSLNRQRAQVHQRFDRIYKELGLIEASGHKSFKQHKDKGTRPLLSTVYSFGKNYTERTPKPTDDVEVIKQAVQDIANDPTGDENVFTAVYNAVGKYRDMRTKGGRNVMVVTFIDEVGDDQVKGLEPTVELCKKTGVPVFVVGVPAPFGRQKLEVKWVDPDPKYDQTPQWGEVVQGPETFQPERINLSFGRGQDEPIDSGFGPYALTRLAYETGGMYFTVHPNRNVHRAVTKQETEVLTSYIKHFFDPVIMHRYRPDYVSIEEYKALLAKNKARYALVLAAHKSHVGALKDPRMNFPKRSEADLANLLTEAQKNAAKLAPVIDDLYGVLKAGEEDRDLETKLRWRAGYDLAMGRVLAAKVRTDGYNAMLAMAKQGMKFNNEKNDTWDLKPSGEVAAGTALAKLAGQSKMYLERVIAEHDGTPWALLARRELERPLGWSWEERYAGVNRPREAAGGGNNNALPRNDKVRNIAPPKPKRKPPRL